MRSRSGWTAVAGAMGSWAIAMATPRIARADNTNPNIVPLGENEAFLGNTGIGRPDDTGAVYYNPAGLAELTSTKVSLSGTAYTSISEHSDGIANINGTDVPFTASGFNTIPTAFVATAKLGGWVGAASVLVPVSIQFNDQTHLDIPGFPSNLSYSSSQTEAWYGLSLAHKLGENAGFGVSLHGIQHSSTMLMALDGAGGGASVTTISRTSVETYGLLAIMGFTLIASPDVRFGVRVQTAMTQIYGTGKSFKISRTVIPGQTPSPTGEDVSGTANYGVPFDMGFGAAVRPFEWLTVLGDISLQLPLSYQTFPTTADSDAVTLVATPRCNLGLEISPAPAYPVRLGFYYNPTATGGQPGDSGYMGLNYLGFTGGLGFNGEHVHTTVGGFYILGTGKNTSTPPASSNMTITGFGALLTTAYVF